jgi:hypothetical protein
MKSSRIGRAGHVARIGKMRSAYSVLVEKPEGKRPLGKPRHRWDDNIKTNFQSVGWSVDWIDLAPDRERWRDFVNRVMNFRFL